MSQSDADKGKEIISKYESLKDTDGYITTNTLDKTLTDDAKKVYIKERDYSGDNKVSKAEFLYAEYPNKNQNTNGVARQDFENVYGKTVADEIFKSHDINKDDKLSIGEIRLTEDITNSVTSAKPVTSAMFGIFDTNNNGYLSKEEITDAMKSKYGDVVDVSNGSLDKMIDGADLNKDGQISKGEFLFGLNSTSTSQASKDDFIAAYGKEEGTTLFDKYDLNKDGVVTKDEVNQTEVKEAEEAKKAQNEDKGLSGWAIAGIVIGSVVILVLLITLIVCLSSKKKRSNNEEAEENLDSLNNDLGNEMSGY